MEIQRYSAVYAKNARVPSFPFLYKMVHICRKRNPIHLTYFILLQFRHFSLRVPTPEANCAGRKKSIKDRKLSSDVSMMGLLRFKPHYCVVGLTEPQDQ